MIFKDKNMRITNLDTEKIGKLLWRLNSPLTFTTHVGELSVPKNFVTDGASCPKVLWSLCSPMSGPHAEAAVLHDFLYSMDSDVLELKLNRKSVDQLFLKEMRNAGTSWFKARLIYRGVKAGRKGSYKKCYSTEKIKG